MDKQDLKALTKRYLVWLYKTTKEAFDKFERKFTQLEIDKNILVEIEREVKDSFMPSEQNELQKHIEELRNYIMQKESECLKLKYKEKRANPDFIFLDLKLQAIEKIILNELGKDGLREIKQLYEQEMLDRIIKSRDH